MQKNFALSLLESSEKSESAQFLNHRFCELRTAIKGFLPESSDRDYALACLNDSRNAALKAIFKVENFSHDCVRDLEG